MSDHWLEISDESIDAVEIMRRIEQRASEHYGTAAAGAAAEATEDPLAVANALHNEMLAAGTAPHSLVDRIRALERESDIVPHHYTIEWRQPILGRIHAWVRTIIHAEIRRYLLPGLAKQAYLNRQMIELLAELAQENARLCQKLDEFRG